jgi:hypothetical protein
LEATDLIEVSTIESGSYVTRSITGQELIDAIPLPPTGLTVGTTPIASGTVGRVLFQGTGNVLQQSSSLAYDDSTKAFSIVANQNATTSLTLSNNSTGSSSLITSTLISDTAVGNSLLYGSGRVNNNVNQYQTGASYIIDYQGPVSLNLSSTFASGSNSGIRFWTASSTSNGVERMRIASTGNVLINTTTDAGFRLDVNGTARVTGSLSVDTLGTTNAATIGGTLQLISSIAVINKTQTAWISLATRNTSGSEVVYDLSNVGNIIAAGNVGIGTTSPSAKFEVNDSIAWTRSNGGNLLLGYGAESTPRLTLTRDIVGPAGAIAFSQGNSIATTGSAISQNASGNLVFLTSNGTALTERIRIPNTGNVLINTTTDAGYKLDVNGTARFVAPNTYAITYDTNGNFNAAGAYSNFSLTNAAGSLRAKLNNDGPNGTLTLYQNATGYIFLNGAQSGNNSFISTALSIGNQSAANASSILELTSTTKGFLPPRMTTTQKNAIASPAAGLVVYDTTLNKLCVFTTAWETVTSL